MPDVTGLTNNLAAIQTGVTGYVTGIGTFAIAIGAAIAIVFLIRSLIKRGIAGR